MSSSGASISSELSVGSQYGEEFIEENGDGSDDEEQAIQIQETGSMTRVEVEKSSDEPEIKDFAGLTDRERNLPLSYVISSVAQWRAILKSLETKFRVVTNLPKVSDKTLSTIADAIRLAAMRGNEVPLAAYALLEYADKRFVR